MAWLGSGLIHLAAAGAWIAVYSNGTILISPQLPAPVVEWVSLPVTLVPPPPLPTLPEDPPPPSPIPSCEPETFATLQDPPPISISGSVNPADIADAIPEEMTLATPVQSFQEPERETDATDSYWLRVRTRIADQLVYPRFARELRLEGWVTVTLTLDETGQVVDVTVDESAHRLLRQAVLRTVRSVAPFEPPDPGISRRASLRICFSLNPPE